MPTLVPAQQARLEDNIGIVVPLDTGTWSAWTSWADQSVWISAPEDDLIWIVDRIDLERETYFNLTIQTKAVGRVSYKVYTSTTGAFQGEETETVIAYNATNVPAFYGRYFMVAVYVANIDNLQILQNVEVNANTNTFAISRSGVNTNTFSGTTSARVIPLSRNVSHIWSVSVQPVATSYTQDVYVTEYPSATTLIPTVVNKTRSGPSIKLIGLDNVARDAVIDYEIIAMPEQRMDNGNLVSR
jgi:hypothetical protein